jgi:hypothetical protein
MTILNTSITNENANHQPYTGIRTLGAGTYDYQLDVRAKFEGSAYNILTMPSGSGKSFVQAALAVIGYHRLGVHSQANYPRPAGIAAGFFPPNDQPLVFKIQGETKVYSAAVLKEFNLCDSPSVARLVEWLLAEPTSLSQPSETNVSGGLICVTSYYAFALAFGHMTHEEKNTAVRNLHVRADESHHVAMGETKGEAGEKDKVGIRFTHQTPIGCGCRSREHADELF